jgi:hypothetical protein
MRLSTKNDSIRASSIRYPVPPADWRARLGTACGPRCCRSVALVLAASTLGLGGRATRAAVIPYSGTATTFTAPATGLYQITADGGGGGNAKESGSPTLDGGDGAIVTGTFSLTAGEQLNILIGGQGGTTYGSGGGGGGTYVVDAGVQLLIAGGGGGASGDYGGSNAQGLSIIGGVGGTGGGGNTDTSVQGSSGGGGGGGYSTGGTAGASGEYLTDGLDPGGSGGASYVDGGAGGGGVHTSAGGGFGGGGGGGDQTGGGGGGYTGGNGGDGTVRLGGPGFGGTSYDAGLNTSFALAASPANGSVTVTGVPEPASLGLIATGGLTLFQRRRRAADANGRRDRPAHVQPTSVTTF